MGQDRLGYRDGAILIEAARILTPQFNSATITLTGAQVELLRNATAVFHEERTFVSTYHDTYYYTATTADFDSISAIVASLEEKLMGDINTPWGYYEQLFTREDHTAVAAGTFPQTHPEVPPGEVWVVTGVSINTDTTGSTIYTEIDTGIIKPDIAAPGQPVNGVAMIPTIIPVFLHEGDAIYFLWTGVVIDQRLITDVLGYKMLVPA